MPTRGRISNQHAPVAGPTVSVVIPALNEAAFLPGLLDALAGQSLRPSEVVVADAGSRDDTAEVARKHGAQVVAGGHPGVGRNAGARVATGELLLFLDADALPPPDFVARAVREFERRGLDVATAPIVPLEGGWDLRLAYVLTEVYLRALVRVSPHAVGGCILARRTFHRRLGGFDESLALGEDHDYARRAARAGRYGVLWSVRIPISMRRILHSGRWAYIRVLVKSEVRTLTGRPIRRLPEGYRFGGFTEPPDPEGRRRLRPRQWARVLRRPPVELQGDAVALLATSAVLSAASALSRTRAGRLIAATSAAVAVASGLVALQPLRWERSYGRFFSATVAVADHDLVDASGVLLARAGEDLLCEFHAVHDLRTLARLRRDGRRGRLAARLEILEAIRELWLSFDDPHYAGVAVLVARADIARALQRIGFAEVPHPPPLDLANRIEKRLLARRIGTLAEQGERRPESLVALPRDRWTDDATRDALDAWIARTRDEWAAANREDDR